MAVGLAAAAAGVLLLLLGTRVLEIRNVAAFVAIFLRHSVVAVLYNQWLGSFSRW